MGLEFLIKNDQNIRLDKYLAGEIENMTRAQVQLLISEGQIRVNGKAVKASYLIKTDDLIQVNIPEPTLTEIKAEKIPLDIYYEDSDLIVINKPVGMVVHPAAGNYQGTLVNALLHHCQDLSGINGTLRPGIVHRIDKDTSGLLVACKNDFTHRALSKQFINKSVTRKYHAIVHGIIDHNVGRIEAPIGRDPKNRKLMDIVDGGKNAITNFLVLERFKNQTYLELSLETGRTHQIRVHMKYIGYPIVGDPQYGLKKDISPFGQYLHAITLGFIHPRTGENMEWSTPLPDYFKEYLEQARNK
jgi:23S rRNA pseudouridine1911/1915/1917 synthase